MKFLKYLNIRRFFLNIGFLCLVTALLFGIRHIYENSFIKKVTGTVINAELSDYSYTVIESDGSEYTVPEYRYDIMYITLDNHKYTNEVYRKQGEYELDQQLDILYDERNPEKIEFYPVDHSFAIIAWSAVGIVLIIIFRKGFDGYINDFVKRYPKSCLFSIITLPVPAIYYYTKYLHPSFSMFFMGLGEAVMLLFLMGAVPLANVIVWTVSAVKYCRRQAVADGNAKNTSKVNYNSFDKGV